MWNQPTIRSRIIVATVLGLSLLGVIAYHSSSGQARALVDQTLLMRADGDLRAAHVRVDPYLGGVSLRDGRAVDGTWNLS